MISSPFSSTTWFFFDWIDAVTATLLVPLYACLAAAYLLGMATCPVRVHKFVLRWLVGDYSYDDRIVLEQRRKRLLQQKPRRAVVAVPGGEEDAREEGIESQPFDLSGAYKLVSNDNFEEFLAVQGVPWALRSAANKARPIHRITHRGRTLTIKIEGIIESQTTFLIDGPPVETCVRGRVFEDRVSYLSPTESEEENNENGNAASSAPTSSSPPVTGIVVKKRAITENYDLVVQRVLSEDKQTITMTSTAYFRSDEDGDGAKPKDPVTSTQIFQRIEG